MLFDRLAVTEDCSVLKSETKREGNRTFITIKKEELPASGKVRIFGELTKARTGDDGFYLLPRNIGMTGDFCVCFRLREDVPLVVPEVNPEDVKQPRGIISNPNCSTIIAVTAVNALRQLSPIVSMVASTYQAVSGAGAGGPMELSEQVSALAKNQPVEPKVFPYQIAFNLIPQIGSEQEAGYTSEEMKLQYEGRKILHLPQMNVSCTCVRVPVVRSHSISLRLKFEARPSVYEARRAIQFAPGCKLVDDLAEKQYPMPLDTSDQDLVYVGRIRQDLTDPDGLCLWCCGDQIRKGAATNAIQIAELLIGK